ncbi:MAG: hypothetical protein ACYTAF_15855 [Planctomycetota bacterium]|jgi:hypothetical protein
MLEHRDICSTCIHTRTCIHRIRSQRPIHYCEEFAIAPYVAPAGPVVQEKTSGPGPEKGEEHLKGLCINCENRKGCKLPKTEGGVWHCEEYA